MTTSIEKLHRLLHELTQATIQGKLSWEDTADDEEFRAVLKPGMVRIGRRVALYDDGSNSRYFALTLLNREGRIAEEFDARESPEIQMSAEFAELFELARRSALKGDALFDDLLADLEKRLVQS